MLTILIILVNSNGRTYIPTRHTSLLLRLAVRTGGTQGRTPQCSAAAVPPQIFVLDYPPG